MDNDLYLTILDTTVVRTDAMRCCRCKSYEHIVTSCPFPSEYQMEANKSSKKTKKNFRSCSIVEKKDAITVNLENARQFVVECMCARVVEGTIQEADAQHVNRYSSPLNLINLELGLANHPDKLFVEQILDYTKNDVSVSYSGPRKLRIHKKLAFSQPLCLCS